MDINLILQFIVEASQNTGEALSMSWFWFWQHLWPWIWEWVIIGILYKAIFVHYMAKFLTKWGKRHLIKTREQIALYHHYRDRAMKKGHLSDFEICFEGLCKEAKVSE